MDLKLYMGRATAAQRYGVHQRTIDRWIAEEFIAATKIRHRVWINVRRADAAVKKAGYDVKETTSDQTA